MTPDNCLRPFQANPPQLHSNLLYIQRYRHQSRFVSEAAYFYTNLASAEEFLKNLGSSSLSMDPGEFERRMQTGGDPQHVSHQSSPVQAAGITLAGEDFSQPQVSSMPTVSSSADVVVSADVEKELPTQMNVEVETERPPSPPLTRTRSIPPSEILEEHFDKGLSVSELEEKGIDAVVEADKTGELQANYRYLYADMWDLSVQDCYNLLQDYKELVFKYVALATSVQAARHVHSLATQTEEEFRSGTNVSSQLAEIFSDGAVDQALHSSETDQVEQRKSMTASTLVEGTPSGISQSEAMFDGLNIHADNNDSDGLQLSERAADVQQSEG